MCEKKNKEFCAITEQGDLGLGAEVFGLQDQMTLNEQSKLEEKENK